MEPLKNVMENVVNIMYDIMQFLSDNKEPNDPSDNLDYPELSLVVSKTDSEKLKENVKATWGGIDISDVNDLFGNKHHDCVESQMIFSKINPFIYGKNNTPKVDTSVLTFKLKECSNQRRKRSSSSSDYLQIPGNVTMTLVTKDLPDMFYMNITPNGTAGMVYHTFNVPMSPISLEISLLPVLENDTFDLYIRQHKMADLDMYDWKVSIPQNLTDSTEEEKFSFFIPASNLTEGLLYVGVKKTTG